MLKCPHCGLLNPDNTEKCDCGYLFAEGRLQLKIKADNGIVINEVVIKDIGMKFGSMVWFMVKWAFASIPALIIIAAIIWVFVFLFILFFGSLGQILK
ncbi:MAG: hypothetical protein L6Q53_03990 [Candidatus Brocadia sinica]|nr:hypothetical protein [Candidatus Brocadia sinica]